jgi:DNA-binding protein HU-beta
LPVHGLPKEITVPPAKKASTATRNKASAARAVDPVTVTLRHLAAALADSHDLPKKQAEAVLGDLVTLTTKHLKKGNKIRLTGIGVLQVRKRAARMGRNPATGEAIKIKASKKVAFRPAKELREAV